MTTAILVGSIGLGSLNAQAAEYEDATNATSQGTITILENEDGDNVIPDPEDPDQPIEPDPDNPINPNPGLLRINYISDFDFGEHMNTSSAITMNAKLDSFLLDEQGIERVPLVAVQDLRGSDRKGWELQVSQPEGLTDEDGHELNGATITLSNLRYTNPTNTPTVTSGNIVLNTEGQTLAIADETQGAGAWSLALGNATNEGTTDGVQLHIPTNTVKNNTEYSTTLVWELIADPTGA